MCALCFGVLMSPSTLMSYHNSPACSLGSNDHRLGVATLECHATRTICQILLCHIQK